MNISSKKYKAAVIGSTGYTGLALLEILIRHPNIEIDLLASEQYKDKKFSDVYPAFKGILDKKCESATFTNLQRVDVIFFATPNGVAHKSAPRLVASGKKVIDLSADYRFRNLKVYDKWYKNSGRQDTKTNKNAIYGLVEFKRDEIKKLVARDKDVGVLIGNPGCYTTASILALSPILELHAKIKAETGKDLCDLRSIIIDAKSGISGAGRKPSTSILFTELNESLSPYNLANQHRHGPELEVFFDELMKKHNAKEEKIALSFSPHLIPMSKGLLATCYININPNCKIPSSIIQGNKSQKKSATVNENFLRSVYQTAYQDEFFIELLGHESGKPIYPNTKWTLGTNRALLQLVYDERLSRLIVTSAIDNLIKGAAGQAVQNMNLLLNLAENTALDFAPALP